MSYNIAAQQGLSPGLWTNNYGNQQAVPMLWPKQNPFLPFDRAYARMELTKLLMSWGQGAFLISFVDIIDHTELGVVINGLQSLGLVSMRVAHSGFYECKITERGLMIIKEE